MSVKSDARKVILELANEDYYGLWEICWKVRELIGDDSRLLEVVEAELARLEQDGLIKFFERAGAESEPVPLHGTDWRNALSIEAPALGERQVLVAGTSS